MYIGIGAEEGKKVSDKMAYSYAFHRCLTTEIKGFAQFCVDLEPEKEELEVFKKELVDWFYSGNWVYEKEE